MRVGLAALLALGIGAAAIVVWLAVAEGRLRGQIASGRRIYDEQCASCHGKQLEGQPNWKVRPPTGRLPAPPHDATGHTWHHTDGELLRITKGGLRAIVPDYESDMPAFDGVLSGDEISAVLAFIKGTWPERERNYQRNRTQAVDH